MNNHIKNLWWWAVTFPLSSSPYSISLFNFTKKQRRIVYSIPDWLRQMLVILHHYNFLEKFPHTSSTYICIKIDTKNI